MKKPVLSSFVVGLVLGLSVVASPVLAKKSGNDVPPPPERPLEAEVLDPLEPVNRLVFGINDLVDIIVIRPVVIIWKGIMPQPVQTAVGNVFSNLDDVFAGASHALQGNGQAAATDFGRVIINTTVGVGGLVDVASDMGMYKVRGDFGQTLGVWGLPSGPYIVLPLLGPSTLRETAGRAGRYYADPRTYMDPEWGYSLVGLEYLQARADQSDTDSLLDVSSFDKYVFVRNLYLQRRAALVREGIEGSQSQP